jgi:D-arabinose 1-dehydrogenase-like Zn-dependent alcohol dehydrogenase
MKAAILDKGKVEIKDMPKPTPLFEEALVRLTAAGVCHSDIHLVKGDWRVIPIPIPLGHEGIGIVEALGPGAEKSVSIGDRVILGLGGGGGLTAYSAVKKLLKFSVMRGKPIAIIGAAGGLGH